MKKLGMVFSLDINMSWGSVKNVTALFLENSFKPSNIKIRTLFHFTIYFPPVCNRSTTYLFHFPNEKYIINYITDHVFMQIYQNFSILLHRRSCQNCSTLSGTKQRSLTFHNFLTLIPSVPVQICFSSRKLFFHTFPWVHFNKHEQLGQWFDRNADIEHETFSISLSTLNFWLRSSYSFFLAPAVFTVIHV